MFKSDENKMYNSPAYKFSLAGLLKYAESKGYAIGNLIQPPGLKLQLYEFQLSTLKWMLDKENDDGDMGLNGEFWDEIQSNDGLGNMYYFPIGGELRLEKPPKTTGGLLSEEMGLGKTIEVLALILANQCKLPSVGSLDSNTGGRISRATLIVVPSTLSSQWWREIKNNINLDETTCVDYINVADQANRIFVSIDDVRLAKESIINNRYYELNSSSYNDNDDDP
jgi:SNF2 family DNA or RNA helicase